MTDPSGYRLAASITLQSTHAHEVLMAPMIHTFECGALRWMTENAVDDVAQLLVLSLTTGVSDDAYHGWTG